jgi:hypothetical protein
MNPMAQPLAGQDPTRRDRPLTHRCLPVLSAGGEVDLSEDDVDHAVEKIFLVGHVVVQRHRLDPDRLAELAHAQRLGPALVGEGDRGVQDPVPGERGAGRSTAGGRGVHVRAPVIRP